MFLLTLYLNKHIVGLCLIMFDGLWHENSLRGRCCWPSLLPLPFSPTMILAVASWGAVERHLEKMFFGWGACRRCFRCLLKEDLDRFCPILHNLLKPGPEKVRDGLFKVSLRCQVLDFWVEGFENFLPPDSWDTGGGISNEAEGILYLVRYILSRHFCILIADLFQQMEERSHWVKDERLNLSQFCICRFCLGLP